MGGLNGKNKSEFVVTVIFWGVKEVVNELAVPGFAHRTDHEEFRYFMQIKRVASENVNDAALTAGMRRDNRTRFFRNLELTTASSAICTRSKMVLNPQRSNSFRNTG
jgi:hypothetical protein